MMNTAAKPTHRVIIDMLLLPPLWVVLRTYDAVHSALVPNTLTCESIITWKSVCYTIFHDDWSDSA